jgi:PspA-Associated protein
MIVRISGEDQYRLADDDAQRLNELDNAVVAAAEGGDEASFGSSFSELLEFVRAHGERIGEDELAGSDVILPPPDISIAEAVADFTGDGLIPD